MHLCDQDFCGLPVTKVFRVNQQTQSQEYNSDTQKIKHVDNSSSHKTILHKEESYILHTILWFCLTFLCIYFSNLSQPILSMCFLQQLLSFKEWGYVNMFRKNIHIYCTNNQHLQAYRTTKPKQFLLHGSFKQREKIASVWTTNLCVWLYICDDDEKMNECVCHSHHWSCQEWWRQRQTSMKWFALHTGIRSTYTHAQLQLVKL